MVYVGANIRKLNPRNTHTHNNKNAKIRETYMNEERRNKSAKCEDLNGTDKRA